MLVYSTIGGDDCLSRFLYFLGIDLQHDLHRSKVRIAAYAQMILLVSYLLLSIGVIEAVNEVYMWVFLVLAESLALLMGLFGIVGSSAHERERAFDFCRFFKYGNLHPFNALLFFVGVWLLTMVLENSTFAKFFGVTIPQMSPSFTVTVVFILLISLFGFIIQVISFRIADHFIDVDILHLSQRSTHTLTDKSGLLHHNESGL